MTPTPLPLFDCRPLCSGWHWRWWPPSTLHSTPQLCERLGSGLPQAQHQGDTLLDWGAAAPPIAASWWGPAVHAAEWEPDRSGAQLYAVSGIESDRWLKGLRIKLYFTLAASGDVLGPGFDGMPVNWESPCVGGLLIGVEEMLSDVGTWAGPLPFLPTQSTISKRLGSCYLWGDHVQLEETRLCSLAQAFDFLKLVLLLHPPKTKTTCSILYRTQRNWTSLLYYGTSFMVSQFNTKLGSFIGVLGAPFCFGVFDCFFLSFFKLIMSHQALWHISWLTKCCGMFHDSPNAVAYFMTHEVLWHVSLAFQICTGFLKWQLLALFYVEMNCILLYIFLFSALICAI